MSEAPFEFASGGASLPRRIALIGSPGAGKSWLSRRLAEKTGLPLCHLDHLFWRPGWKQVPREEFRASVVEWAARDEWILDGNYTSTMDERLARAELVVWMDPPTVRCLGGIMRRWWIDAERSDTPEGCPDRPDWQFFHYTLVFRMTRNPVIRRKLKGFSGRVVHLRSRRNVRRFLDSVHPAGEQRVTLPDGLEVIMRPIRPADRALFERGIREASPAMLASRFHSAGFRPGPAHLDYLTQVDQHDHIAVGAALADGDGERGIGVARCVRKPGTSEAEIAVAVLDEFQRRGVGRALVRSLVQLARREDISELVGYLDVEQRHLIRHLRTIGFTSDPLRDGIFRVRLPLAASAELPS